jgi:hypothetical protein
MLAQRGTSRHWDAEELSMLKFENSWRFDSPGPIPVGVVRGFSELIGRIAMQGNRQSILEHFKRYFAGAAGTTPSWSSSESWAESDLHDYMRHAAENAPLFIEAFYDACEALRGTSEMALPDLARINRVLSENAAGFEIDPPNLISQNVLASIPVPGRTLSLDEQAQILIQKSLKDSEQLLSEGRYKQAVQEILRLLETVSTAFQGIDAGLGTIEGKYFNKIVQNLRKIHKGQTLEQVLSWVKALHGYLSSPTGGGIRHGTTLRAATAMHPNEARLFCNLIRSYITFLLAEHEQLTGPS